MTERELEEFNRIQEENEKLREILQGIAEGPYSIGKVKAGPDAIGYYRVEAGSDVRIFPLCEALQKELKDKDKVLKEGTTVIYNKDCIIRVLPAELEEKVPPVEFNFINWDEIGGIKSQVARIREVIEGPIKHQALYKKFNRKPSKGILLYGPPGCGKTLIAKAIASQLLEGQTLTQDSFIYLKGGEMLNPYVGVAERNIQDLFERARKTFKRLKTRTVIFIDEAEAILPTRGSRKSSDVETTIVPTFISEMDGLEDSNTFIILATNHKEQLDPAVIRPGRIDLCIPIDRPTLEDTAEIFEIHLKNTLLDGDIHKLAEVAANHLFQTPLVKEVSGALIANLVQDSITLAIRDSIKSKNTIPVNAKHLLSAIGFTES